MLIARYELRDMTDPLAEPPLRTMGVPDAELHLDGILDDPTEVITVKVRHVQPKAGMLGAFRGAYCRTSRYEFTLAVAEAERFVGLGAQLLFAAVRDQVVARAAIYETEKLGKAIEMRPGNFVPPPPPPTSYVPRSYNVRPAR